MDAVVGWAGRSFTNHPIYIDRPTTTLTPTQSQLLKTIAVEREPKRKRDVIKKVIAYMTLGIDVSRLFTEMVLAIETHDLVSLPALLLIEATSCPRSPGKRLPTGGC